MRTISAIFLLFASLNATAQNKVADTCNQQEVINNLITNMKTQYVFPAVAENIGRFISEKQRNGEYKAVNEKELATLLTADLQKISNDRHLRVEHTDEVLPAQRSVDMSVPVDDAEGLSEMFRNLNYGIRKLDILKGNIGYIDFEFFCAPQFAGDTYAAAMNYLAHTEALIIDLRQCGGSRSPEAVPFISSYFFDEVVHLNTIHWRKKDSVTKYFTTGVVAGKKYTGKPIFILTSNASFSGAEAMAYELQALKRAVVVGDVTGGGANPGGYMRISDHFQVFIPVGQVIHPITGTNWEGRGVQPDYVINPKHALVKAHEMAMDHVIRTTKVEPWKQYVNMLKQEMLAGQPVD